MRLFNTIINQSINMRICIAQNKQSKMSSNALSVSALEQASFHLFARHTVVVCRSVSRAFHVAWPHTLNVWWPRTVLLHRLSSRSCCLPANDDTGTQSLLRYNGAALCRHLYTRSDNLYAIYSYLWQIHGRWRNKIRRDWRHSRNGWLVT